MKRILLTIMVGAGFFTLAACGSDENADADADYTIGATQITEHPSLDSAYDGFKKALDDNNLDVEYDYQSAQNNQDNVNTIGTNFVNDEVDLIFANSTPSTLGALSATKKASSDIPILFTSVTDAVESGLVSDMEASNKQIAGVLDQHPKATDKTISFIESNFPDSSVGLIYNAGEDNSVAQIESIKKTAEDTSLTFEERTVSNASEVQQAASSLASEVDVFLINTDNTVVSAIESVVGVANEQSIPLIVSEKDSLSKGAFATFGIDYNKIGYRTGEMAAEILKGEKSAKDMSIEYPKDIQLYINEDAADAQDIEWQDDWDDAELVETSDE